jgi:hypothetical protein
MRDNFWALFFLILSVIVILSGLYLSIRVRRSLPLPKSLKVSAKVFFLSFELMGILLTIYLHYVKPDLSIENFLFCIGFITLANLLNFLVSYAKAVFLEKAAKESNAFREVTDIVEKIEHY